MDRLRAHIWVALLLMAVSSAAAGARTAIGERGVSIVDTVVGGERRYTVIADNAEISDLLKQLFAKTGDEFSIDQGVAGAVNLKVRDASLEQVFARISEVARPPLKIRHEGKYYHVAPDLSAIPLSQGPPPVVRGGGSAALHRPFPQVAGGYQALAPANRPVTLDVPKDRPIPLALALDRISAQTGYPVRLDPRVPAQLTFSGTITSAPLSMVLQAIGESSALKIVDYGSYAMLAPADTFMIRWNQAPGAYTGISCPNCGERLQANWRYCPSCGVQIARPQQAPGTRGPTTIRKFQR